MNEEFPFHEDQNPSRLEAHREAIIKMRANRWPYRRIAEWLAGEQSLQISHEAIRQFCLSRRIQKGRGKPLGAPTAVRQDTATPLRGNGAERREFSFDASKPIRTLSNQ